MKEEKRVREGEKEGGARGKEGKEGEQKEKRRKGEKEKDGKRKRKGRGNRKRRKEQNVGQGRVQKTLHSMLVNKFMMNRNWFPYKHQ